MVIPCFILAGGKGTRLRPATYKIPKPLLKVGNKPMINHTMHFLKKNGITDIFLSIGYLKDLMKAYIGSGSKFGVKIKYIEESKEMGTGGALALARDKLKTSFVIINSDELTNMDLNELYKVHKKNKALVTLGLSEVEDPSKFGVVKMDKDKIIQFIEKPEKGKEPSNLVNMGICIAEPEVISMIPKGFVSLERQIFPKIVKMGKMYGYKIKGYWQTIGTHSDLKKARNFLKNRKKLSKKRK